MSHRRALIAGLGAMGTSIALALDKEKWDVYFTDKPGVSDTREATKGRGNYDDGYDLTVIATWEDEALDVLPQTRGLVTSICSLMEPLRRVAAGNFVAGHPMAGTEKSGQAGAKADMYIGKLWFIERDEPVIRELIEDCGAHVEVIDAMEHDRGVAAGSALPQIFSTALGAYFHDKQDLLRFSATGLETFLRLAGSPVEMWKPLIRDNAGNIAPHAEAVAQLVREMLQKDADPTELFKRANETYRRVTTK
jgi:prephenate dehydrogenase